MGVGARAKPQKVPAAGGGGKVEQRRRETGGDVINGGTASYLKAAMGRGPRRAPLSGRHG